MDTNVSQKTLDIIQDAICDTGVWSWWDSDLPNIFQLEFDRVQLLTLEQEKTKAPSSTIALVFLQPYRVAFSEVGNTTWYEQIKNGTLDPLELSPNALQFNESPSFVNSVAPSQYFFHSNRKKVKNFISASLEIAEYRVFIEAESLIIKDINGDIEYSEIKSRNQMWWDYWKQYWDHKGTGTPYPYDFTCEATIPIAKK